MYSKMEEHQEIEKRVKTYYVRVGIPLKECKRDRQQTCANKKYMKK